MIQIRRLARYLRPYSGLAFMSLAYAVLIAGTVLLSPWPIKLLFDSVLSNQPLSGLPAALLGSMANDKAAIFVLVIASGLLIAVVHNVLTVASEYVTTRIGHGVALELRSDLFQHAQRLSLSLRDPRRAGESIHAIGVQAQSAVSLITTLQPLLQSTVLLIGMLWISLKLDAQLTLLAVSIIPLLYYFGRYYLRSLQVRLAHVEKLEGESLSIIHEAIAMLRSVVAFGREGYEYGRFRTRAEETARERLHLTLQQALAAAAVNMMTVVGTALVLAFGAYHALQGRLSGGELLVLLFYVGSAYRPLESLASGMGAMQEQFANTSAALDLLDREPAVQDAPRATKMGRASGRVSFHGVHFSYPGSIETLKDISFGARAGQVVAVIGPPGAGKTTLVGLIPRFFDPTQGHILIDGQDIRQIELRSLRQQVSLLLGDPPLFSGTVAENIGYGRPEAVMGQIVQGAKAANAHDFIMNLPEQYDTIVGERGLKLSAGERQLISIARAFLRDAPILILDELTSSLDSTTEATILEMLPRLIAGRTTFIVAQRLSTVHHPDLILVMDRGQIVERGTREELAQREGLYSRLH